jgi:hypothetical protein
MLRSAARLFHLFVSAVLLTGLFLPAAHADSPTLTAKFGVAGHYRPGGWCLVTVGVQNPGADTISGQIQVLTNGDAGRSPYGGRAARQDTPAVVYACPVSVPGGSAAPHYFALYLRGIDPGQADFTVQLAEGRERGDGRVLASINSQNQNTSQAFTGGPVGTNDTLLVGFGGDPSAFMFLSGRHLAAANAPSISRGNPNGLSTGTPATVQIAEAATAAELPDKAAGYDGVSAFLLRSDAPIEAMTEAQSEALKGWVASGGHLVVCGGPDSTRFGSAFFEGLLPATVGSSNSFGALTLTPKPLPGVRVLQSAPGGQAQIVSGPYGAGTVTLTAFDPTAATAPAANAFALPTVWQTLLFSQLSPNSSVLGMTAAREDNFGAIYYGSAPPLLSEAVMRGPSLDAPGTSVIAVFLLVYLIVLVPVNYFVLKKYDRKELAWLTIPALVFVFAAGTFGVGYAAKGGSVFVNRAALIETRAGQSQAGVYAEVGLFSPHRTTYDMALSGDNLLAAVPSPGINYGGGGGDASQFSGPVQFVETPAGVSLPNTPVNMWAMRAFDVQSTIDLGGAIDSSLTATGSAAAGTILNHTAYSLTNCAVLYAGRWLPIGTLAPGATVTIPTGVPQAAFPFSSPAAEDQAGIRDRMHTALGEYFRSLGQSSPNYSNGSSSPPVYSPATGEALLAGWSSDPKLAGPASRVDGSPVTENDVSLVIVHLPVSGAPQNSAPFVFPAVPKSSPAYQSAVDVRVSAFALRRVSANYSVRGIVVAVKSSRLILLNYGLPSDYPTLRVLVPPRSPLETASVRALLGREVIVDGTLLSAAPGHQTLSADHLTQVQTSR